MRYVADLHIHTRYSRATSRNMNLETLAKTAKIKGVNLLGTGDITHPEWRKELREKLKPAGRGIFQYDGVDFILSGEVSNIYKKDGRLRKIHIVLLFPDFEKAERFSSRMAAFGSLTADGRPTFGLDVEKMTEIVMEISEDIM
ncbi:MAG: DNA helicase UvrD, partial [Candidatus Hydrothermae bacterium]|nr:DNA helicase UvrD [Candidatus Hydrothermae bacterium]